MRSENSNLYEYLRSLALGAAIFGFVFSTNTYALGSCDRSHKYLTPQQSFVAPQPATAGYGANSSFLAVKKVTKKLRKRNLKRICKRYLSALAVSSCPVTSAQNKRALCDADADRITSRDETKWVKTSPFLADTDLDGLSDGAEQCEFFTNPKDSDSDNDGISDGEEVGGQNPPTGDCDASGNTTSFGIPAGLSGNITVGEDVYSTVCMQCHAAASELKGHNKPYDFLRPTLAAPPMSLNLSEQQVADLVAFLNKDSCASETPTPVPTDSQTPTPTPTSNPPPPPTSGACDLNGNTSAFGIPSGVVGNITQGALQYQANIQGQNSCQSCHATQKGTNYHFDLLRTTLAGDPMYITNLNTQQIANLVAYLNRRNCNYDGVPTPIPTPTPADPVVRGLLVFRAACGCHNNAAQFRNLTRQQLDEAIRDKPAMRDIVLSEQEYSDLFAYLRTL